MSSVENVSVESISAKLFLEKAASLLNEIPVLSSKITKATELETDEIPQVFSEVLKFLHLIGRSNKRLTPSLIVDLAWHEFILCTWHYHAYCQEQFGRYIHHHPGGDEKENNDQFLLTQQLYQTSFGTPPTQYWGGTNQANCGICEAI